MTMPYQQNFKGRDAYVYEGVILTNDMVWHMLTKVGVMQTYGLNKSHRVMLEYIWFWT